MNPVDGNVPGIERGARSAGKNTAQSYYDAAQFRAGFKFYSETTVSWNELVCLRNVLVY